MRLPDFLIIGAMKCGTTSLYFDLRANPSIYLPEDKEPANLKDDSVLEQAGRKAYARLFRPARRNQICGEASTDYSKLPDITGVPRRALSLLGRELKIIYLVREPVARLLSHHYLEVTRGTMEPDVELAVRRHSRLFDFGRYAMQLRPWLDGFGRDRIHVVRFEDYVGDRGSGTADICRFLGAPSDSRRIEIDKVHNRGEDALVPEGFIWRFSRGRLYRSVVRPWVSRTVRTKIRRIVQPPAPPRPGPPTRATMEYILERAQGHQEELQRLLGSDAPRWDLDAVRKRYLETENIADP